MTTKPRYKNPNLPADERTADLLNCMTLVEKITQMNQVLGWKAYRKNGDRIEVVDEFCTTLTQPGAGSIYGVLRADPWTGVTLESGLGVREGTEVINALQKYAIEHTRLGIPLLFGEECSHGHMAIGATVFPAPITIGQTWNPVLYREMCIAVATETRAQGCTVTYSPVLDLARDPRWGRCEETFGEDPYLTSRMTEAAVHGLQGDNLNSVNSILATLKHFAAYGVPEGGHNGGMAHIGPRELREVYLKPFEAGVRAGALSLMTAYNEIDGIPCGANHELLTGVLRDKWGFQGFVISDLACLRLLWEQLHVAPDLIHAGSMALKAGVDLEMFGGAYSCETLTAALESGLITIADIDRAVSRILRVKFLLGIFEHPYADPQQAADVVRCERHRLLALDLARQGIVLLKNPTGLLPLSKDVRSIAVIGPNADAIYNQLGDYTAPQPREHVATVLDGVREKVSANTIVRYAKGCAVRDPSMAGFAYAIEIARLSDVAIVVVGGSSARDFGQDVAEGGIPTPMTGNGGCCSQDMECGEGLDRFDLEFSGVQLDLLKAIYDTKVPMMVVLIKGRPLLLNWLNERDIPILDAGYPGSEGGRAIADVLFGDYNPAGRLTMSVPRSMGQLPVNYSSKVGSRTSYVDGSAEPLYPFGYGLSYTHFTYANLRVTPPFIRAGGTTTVSIDVKNAGKFLGEEVVQFYLRDEISSVTRPHKELKGFRRISLKPDEIQTVTLNLGKEEMQLLDANLNPVVEPGTFTIMVGGNSLDLQSIQFEVTSE